MQKENSGSSQDKKQEDTKKMQNSGSGASPDVGGNEYTAAFILYCQKTLDNFRSVYGDMYSSEAALGSGSVPMLGSGISFGAGPSSSASFGSNPASENDEFELEQDYPTSDKDKEALEELSEQFEQMLRAKADFEDDDELDEDDKSKSDDYKEKEALRELSEQFEQMLRAKAEFEDNDELERGGRSESDDHQEKEALEEFFEQFEQMFNSKTDNDDDDDDDDDELERGDRSESDDHQEKEALEEFFEQFEQMLKTEAEPGNNSLESEQDNSAQSRDHKGKEALKELLGQFEQMLNTEAESDSDDFELEQDNRSQSNGYKEKEELEELLEQPGPVQKSARGSGAVSHAKDGSESHGEEKAPHNVTGPSSPSQGEGLNDAEIDEALSGVGEVVKSAKENLGIVEAFWEEPESQRAKLLVKAEITQEQFEQVVTRAGSYLYDVKDCLEGWGDLSMLPETYEQLLLANNELSEIFEKMYGKKTVEVQNKRKGLVSEKEDDLELEDSVEVGDWALDDEDDWDFDDDDDDDD